MHLEQSYLSGKFLYQNTAPPDSLATQPMKLSYIDRHITASDCSTFTTEPSIPVHFFETFFLFSPLHTNFLPLSPFRSTLQHPSAYSPVLIPSEYYQTQLSHVSLQLQDKASRNSNILAGGVGGWGGGGKTEKHY